MEWLWQIFHNYVIQAAVISWALAQILKLLLVFVTQRKWDPERLVGAGGMPSAHSASVCGVVVAIARQEGTASPLFALAFLFAMVVMYDAVGVRRAAGEHAKRLNNLHHQTGGGISNAIPILKESLGHTPFQVLAGALLGITVALLLSL